MASRTRGLKLLKMCRAEYIRLARQVQRQGLSVPEIEQSVLDFAEVKNGKAWVKSLAYSPTGVALGCPLPDEHLSRYFWKIAQLMESKLQGWSRSSEPVFAYVPKESYHITILNRSHYETTSVFPMEEDEFPPVKEAMAKIHLERIHILSCGLVLTSAGKLFVKCLPADDRILELREHLIKEVPFLRVNAPRMIHIKLGHILTPLDKAKTCELLAWLQRLDQLVIGQLEFLDLYTPVGRIGL